MEFFSVAVVRFCLEWMRGECVSSDPWKPGNHLEFCMRTLYSNFFFLTNKHLFCINVIVYYVPRRIMRVITRRATMLAEDRSQGAISPARILSESRNYPNCVHWHIFYFMWLRCVYEFLCVHSNPIGKGRNCRDYRPSHLTFRKYFWPFWFSRSCVVAAYCNRACTVQMYKALSVRFQRCTKKKNKKKIMLRCMVIGTCAVQFLHYIPL